MSPPNDRRLLNSASDGRLPVPAVVMRLQNVITTLKVTHHRCAPVALRWALGLTLLSAVADRFGWWGRPGGANVSWGDWAHFVAYTAKVNSFLPGTLAPALACVATAAEILLGIALLMGMFPRGVALACAGLFAAFAVAMTLSFGAKSPLNFSVFADAAAAFLLAAWPATNP